jgi:predicted dehydrogenase
MPQHGMMIEAVKLLREGIIGNVLAAKCWNIQRRGSIGRGQDTDPPAGFDYDAWVGPATMIPYRTNRVHNRWTWWYHFGTGDMGNDGVHDIDYTRWGLGVETHPSKVVGPGRQVLLRRRPGVPRHAAGDVRVSRRAASPATASC